MTENEVKNEELEQELVEEMTEEEQEAEEIVEETEEVFEQELAMKNAQVADLKDKYQRQIAEFDNFRRRTAKEKIAMFDNGAKEVLEALLPVVDNFERAIEHISDEEKDLAITKGVDMIYKQLMGVLSEVGVEEIEAKGNEFDPNLHHAVSHEDSEEHGENEVADVFQKGYTYKENVLRHSMVKVVN